jgi:fimbrial chaperone protein
MHSAVAAAVGACSLAATGPAFALLVQPVVIRMDTSGPHASAAITVANDRNTPDTVEITLAKLSLPEKGTPLLTPDKGDDFLVFPPIATVLPGKTQVFRIRWVGDPVLAQARTYMFTTSELPIDQKKDSGVQIIYAIQSLVTVTSPGLKSDVSATAVTRTSHDFPGNDGKPARTEAGLDITFVNGGENVAFLSDDVIKLEITGEHAWSTTIQSADVSKYLGLGLLAPNSKRQLFMAIPDVPPSGDVQLTLKHDNLR